MAEKSFKRAFKVRKFALKSIALAVMPLQAMALGLGDIEINSSLNQPLDAEVKLLSVKPGEADDLLVSLASNAAFLRAGIDRPFFLTKLRFTVETKSDGAKVIRVSSKKPVVEPFLNFLIEVDWPRGRLLREYTVLLDPPLIVTPEQMEYEEKSQEMEDRFSAPESSRPEMKSPEAAAPEVEAPAEDSPAPGRFGEETGGRFDDEAPSMDRASESSSGEIDREPEMVEPKAEAMEEPVPSRIDEEPTDSRFVDEPSDSPAEIDEGRQFMEAPDELSAPKPQVESRFAEPVPAPVAVEKEPAKAESREIWCHHIQLNLQISPIFIQTTRLTAVRLFLPVDHPLLI